MTIYYMSFWRVALSILIALALVAVLFKPLVRYVRWTRRSRWRTLGFWLVPLTLSVTFVVVGSLYGPTALLVEGIGGSLLFGFYAVTQWINFGKEPK